MSLEGSAGIHSALQPSAGMHSGHQPISILASDCSAAARCAMVMRAGESYIVMNSDSSFTGGMENKVQFCGDSEGRRVGKRGGCYFWLF